MPYSWDQFEAAIRNDSMCQVEQQAAIMGTSHAPWEPAEEISQEVGSQKKAHQGCRAGKKVQEARASGCGHFVAGEQEDAVAPQLSRQRINISQEQLTATENAYRDAGENGFDPPASMEESTGMEVQAEQGGQTATALEEPCLEPLQESKSVSMDEGQQAAVGTSIKTCEDAQAAGEEELMADGRPGKRRKTRRGFRGGKKVKEAQAAKAARKLATQARQGASNKENSAGMIMVS
jgi:hypothetical protein